MTKPKLANLHHGINLIPEGFNWLIGKGHVSPDEKLYGCVILDQGGDTVGEGESDDLLDAVAGAIADLNRKTGINSQPVETPFVCECCAYIRGIEVPAPHCMEWGEYLCSDCAEQALEENDACPPASPAPSPSVREP